MPAARSQNLLVSAARLYYLENRSQIEVAQLLNVSRSSVSRILSAARDQGLVEIRIHDPGERAHVPEFEEAITSIFGLPATVVPRLRAQSPLDVVASAAARIFEDLLPNLDSVGLSWGATVERFAAAVRVEQVNRAVRVFPLVGGLSAEAGPQGNAPTEVLAAKIGGSAYRFEAPAVVESPQTSAALSGEPVVARALEQAARVKTAFVGIGCYGLHNSRRVIAAMNLSDPERSRLAGQQPAGDICGRFFDIHGRALGAPTSDRVIGVTLDQLSAIPQVHGLAAGAEKSVGVIGALRANVLDTVILDEDLADAVLNLSALD